MNEFMTISEAAETLGVSLLTMREIVKRQNLKVVPDAVDSRQKLVSRSDIQQLKTQTRPKTRRVSESKGVYYATPEERAMLLEALADEEMEDREGTAVTLEEIENMVNTMIENRRNKSNNKKPHLNSQAGA
ncbi:MAG: hypothetical protein J0I20_22220 [Chloroflexi bacterium]|nr:hypothetical protein [Chloroflexota bacterium]OJW05331.1 MAG: hypothetical protein BGO39_33530 [Chloroflexi bacterium 54-19]